MELDLHASHQTTRVLELRLQKYAAEFQNYSNIHNIDLRLCRATSSRHCCFDGLLCQQKNIRSDFHDMHMHGIITLRRVGSG